MEIELTNNLNNDFEQNKFLNTVLGQAINSGINIGLRYILPDYIENQIIEIKDNMMQYGLKEGIKQTINSAVNVGKGILGIFTGNFENTSQIETVVKNGGILFSMSNLIDNVLDKLSKAGKINNDLSKLIKNGKNSILNNIENKLEEEIKKQHNNEKNINYYISEWKENYIKKDINKMDKFYNNIQKEIKNLLPIENTIKEAREIEILHNLIKNNNNNFDISIEEQELAKKLCL